MHTLGVYKNRVYFSHGDLMEGFKFGIYQKKVSWGGSSDNELVEDSGWFEFDRLLLNIFKKSLKSNQYPPFKLPDDQGKIFEFSSKEHKMLLEEFVCHCFTELSEAGLTKQKIFLKTMNIGDLVKIIKR